MIYRFTQFILILIFLFTFFIHKKVTIFVYLIKAIQIKHLNIIVFTNKEKIKEGID